MRWSLLSKHSTLIPHDESLLFFFLLNDSFQFWFLSKGVTFSIKPTASGHYILRMNAIPLWATNWTKIIREVLLELSENELLPNSTFRAFRSRFQGEMPRANAGWRGSSRNWWRRGRFPVGNREVRPSSRMGDSHIGWPRAVLFQLLMKPPKAIRSLTRKAPETANLSRGSLFGARHIRSPVIWGAPAGKEDDRSNVNQRAADFYGSFPASGLAKLL